MLPRKRLHHPYQGGTVVLVVDKSADEDGEGRVVEFQRQSEVHGGNISTVCVVIQRSKYARHSHRSTVSRSGLSGRDAHLIAVLDAIIDLQPVS